MTTAVVLLICLLTLAGLMYALVKILPMCGLKGG
jgi:hypothetical protein